MSAGSGAETIRPDPITDRVGELWRRWYPDLADQGAELELVRIHGRRHSTVHEFAVAAGSRRTVFFAKRPAREGGRSPDRPYGVPSIEIEHRHRAQAEALSALSDAIDDDDPSLGATRVVAVVDDLDLVVTESAQGRPIRSILMEQVWWKAGRSADLGPTFAHTGRLLRRFHDEVPSAGPTLLVTRDELTATAGRFTEHLGERSGSAWFGDLDRRIRAMAERHIPRELEPVTRFGDFGLTNVFATREHRVTAIDTLAACRMAALHDITYFVTGMYLLRPQVTTLGHAIPGRRLERYERELVEGYFGSDPAPWAAYRTWSVVRALERWSAKSLRHSKGVGARVLDRYLRSWIDDRLGLAASGS